MTLMPELEKPTTDMHLPGDEEMAGALLPTVVEPDEKPITMDFADAMHWWRIDGQSGDADRSPYADWTGILRFVMTDHMQTMDDFFPSAVIDEPDVRDLLVRLVDLGRRQFHALVNNRTALVESLNDEIAVLLNFYNGSEELADADDFDAMVRTTLIYIKTLPENERKERLTSLIKERQDRLSYLHATMEKDKEEGHFRDYTDVKRRLASGQASFTDVMGEMPYFLQEAHTIAKSTETNTRRRHFQAIIARLLDTITGQSHKDQRSLQSMIRPNRGGNASSDYDLEDSF